MSTLTKTKQQVVTFKIKSPNNFISFLKRFSPIERSLLLEMSSEGGGNLIAKTHTADKSAIKYSRLAFTEVLEGNLPCSLLKVAILDIEKVVNVFSHFSEGDEIFLDISYDEVNDDTIAFSMKFYTSKLKITLTCADPIQFTYISADSLKRILSTIKEEESVEFDFSKENFSKINSLCKIDAKDELLKIKVSTDGIVQFKSKSFEYIIPETSQKVGKEAGISFYNNRFAFVDQEESKFRINPDKLLVLGEVKKDDAGKILRQTITIIGRVER